MRNLKRALSLTLASVMLLGMMVIGTSAASFTDADQITNETAATVLQELEVMQGSNGKFNPNGTVTRGQMAILICKMLYGSKLNAENFAGTSEFTDVPANAYYTGYVNLASQLGIISGYGNGKFGPGAPVTTAQAALMLTKALGWFQAGELENQSWTSNAIAAVEKATTVNLFGSMKLANDAPLSRDNVCEMVFNALTKTAPVKYNERWGAYYSDEGSIMQGVKFDYTNSLGYKNFTLVYNTTYDDFGRPSTEWGIGNAKDIDTDDHGDITNAVIRTSILKAADEATLSYTTDVKLCDIYKDLGKPSLTRTKADGTTENVTLNYKVNGDSANDNDGGALVVGTFANEESKVGSKGALTEVFRDKNGDIRIRSVETYLVKATADYSTKNEELSVELYKPDDVTLSLANSNKIKNDDVTVSQFKKDDLILVTGTVNSNTLTVKTATLATLVEDVKVSAFKGTKDYVTAGGTKYSYNATTNYDPDTVIDQYNAQKTSYTLVLDKYNNVIGVKKYSSEVSLDDILFVKDAKAISWGYEAKVVFMDGSSKTITIAGTTHASGDEYKEVGSNSNTVDGDGTALTKPGDMSKHRFYEFNVKSNGEYELKDITDSRQGKVNASGDNDVKDLKGGELQPLKGKSKTATNDTIFIAKDTVYTGVKNSPSVTNADVYYLLDSATGNNYILAAFADKKGVSTVDASEYVYVFTGNGRGKDDKDNDYYIYTAIKDGAKVTDFQANDNGKPAGLYKVESYENGYPVLGTRITESEDDVLTYVPSVANTGISYKSGTVAAGGAGFRMADDSKVYVVDSDDKDVDVISASSVGSLTAGSYNVYAIQASTSNKDIVALWLVEAVAGKTFDSTSTDKTGGAVTNALNEGADVNLTTGITGDVAVPAGGKLTMGAGSSVSTKVTLNNGTLVMDGGTLPKVEGEGSVEIKSDVAATEDLNALVTKLSNTMTSINVPATGAGTAQTITIANDGAKLTGEGKLAGFDPNKKISQYIADNANAESVSLFYTEISADKLKEGDQIKVVKVIGNTEVPVTGKADVWTNEGVHTITNDEATNGWGMLLLLPDTVSAIKVTFTNKAG